MKIRNQKAESRNGLFVSTTIVSAFCFLISAFVSGCASNAHFLSRRLTLHGHSYAYRVWIPPHYTRLHRWPVILFLHGSGECGRDNVQQLNAALPVALVKNPSRYRAIVVMPQCPCESEWYGENEDQALAALDQTIREFRGDRRRVILTGVSMGGAGVWYFARNPQRFAAIAPVCGEVVRASDDPFPTDPPRDLMALLQSPDPFAALAARIGKTPVWAFHGAQDPVINVEQSRKMVSALRARHANVRYTEYADLEHAIWDRAYADPALATWMLAPPAARH